MTRRTPLYYPDVALGAKIVDFGGWDMPLHYGSQISEHHAVRRDAGMFDVSHMAVVDLDGPGVRTFLSMLLANDVAKLTGSGRALYSCMLNEQGGVIDDLIVFCLGVERFRVVVNAATRETDLAWIGQQAQGHKMELRERDDLAMVAVQGPSARERASGLLGAADREAALELRPFRAGKFGELFVARTGYTGEDGWEILLPGTEAGSP